MTKKSIHFNILTLFPDMFPGCLGNGVIGNALNIGIWDYSTINIRDFATDKYGSVDDTPYGGGAGMVMKPDILANAIDSMQSPGKIIYLSPRGSHLTQEKAQILAQESTLSLLCGRYEGVDQRVLDAYSIEEISIGDFILAGGEIAAQALMEAVIRLQDGVLGNNETLHEESFDNFLLEYPHYTRPAEWTDKNGQQWTVPYVLTSGNHSDVKQWRLEQAQSLTQERRPDLWQRHQNQDKTQK